MPNISDKTARVVSLKQFSDFVKSNLHLTWFHGEGGAFSSEGRAKDGGPHFKYFYPSLDTRDMHIFHIKTDRYEVDFREEFDGTILDLLLHKMQVAKEVGLAAFKKMEEERETAYKANILVDATCQLEAALKRLEDVE